MSLKINEQGLLLKTDGQIDRFMIESLEQIRGYKPQKLRLSQHDIYNNFVKAKTGEDISISTSRDPFVEVTGYPLKTFALDRFKSYPTSPTVLSATTDLMPFRYLRTARTIQSNYEKYGKEFKLKNKEVITSTFRFPAGPLTLKNSPWKFNYAANDHTFSKKGHPELVLIYGLLFLDEEPVQLLRETPEFESIYRLLLIIVNEFSHDYVGHGSVDFIINDTPEANIYAFLDDTDADVYARTLSELRKQSIAGSRMANIFDEVRQLNLYMRFIEACIRRNNNYLNEISENAQTFFELLQTATRRMARSLGPQVYTFFGQIYLFCAARMLPAHYLHAVVGTEQVRLLKDFIENNEFERTLNILSTIGSGLIVPKQGYGKNVTSCGMDDIAYYMDHRTIFMNVFNKLMK